MINNVVFVSNEVGFLAKALIKRVADTGFRIKTTGVDLTDLLASGSIPSSVFIVYFDGFVQDYEFVLKKLGKIIMEASSQYFLYLIGTPAELDYAYEVIPHTMITRVFKRPVDPNDIINALLKANPVDAVQRKRILVVDDDPQMLRLMKTWLSDAYDVYMANSGKAALSFFEKEGRSVDLILLDYEMPEISGLQTFEMFKNDIYASAIPVMFLTAKDDRDTVLKVLAVHPEKYILKSMPKREILKIVSEFFWKNAN
ncbi:MAG: response regulator [Treponema sp.]|nr:response regulator [Treponema sp.]